MKGRVYKGELISFDTDRAVIKIWDIEAQEPIRINVGANVTLPHSCGWKDLLMRDRGCRGGGS